MNFSNPVPSTGRYFYRERKPDQDQSVLYMKKGLEGQPVEIFNPNSKDKSNITSIDFWSNSKSGKYVAYGISSGGNEVSSIYIKNTDTNEVLGDVLANCRHSPIRWLPDESGLFYAHNPKPGTVPKNEESLHMKVYFHKLGDDQESDQLIFGKDRPKEDMIGLSLSPDGRYLGMNISLTWSENDIYIYDTFTKEVKPLFVGIKSLLSVRFLSDKVLLETNYGANNFRILSNTYDDIYKPLIEWQEFIPERSAVIETIAVTSEKILIQYLVDACSEVVIFDYKGNEIGKIPLPKYSSLEGISSNREEKEFFYGVDSFLFPKITFRYDPTTLQYVEYRRTENPINPDEYEVKQEWYKSNDGTDVPMFIFHRKDINMNGLNPTLLYGYGGFGNTQTPAFMRNWITWIARGGIFAIANIRGGGEFGEHWHKSGIKDKKQNTFDDFIYAAKYLISEKYTDNKHLGIIGGSNGGLLVSAVGVQEPELFAAVCSRVPLTDMVRFPKFGMAIRWVHEYGNPDIKEDLERILKWSPYHNVKVGTKYPPFLFTTADKDTRVDPLHARKMAATLMAANKDNKILIFTEFDAGHGPGKPIKKIVEIQSLILTFFKHHLGLKL